MPAFPLSHACIVRDLTTSTRPTGSQCGAYPSPERRGDSLPLRGRVGDEALLFRLFEDSENLNDKTKQYHNWCKCDSAETENVRIENSRVFASATAHENESENNASDADEHPHVILSAKRKIE